ncbi:PA14 domain-containing protein [uncultured Streptomyces sp.]|uniref:PA14 domain-containing protein n=1 Tax=uncultured Streptomyces sp. TaxID=174707 RepID=UPI00261B3344|nr:PA14 domain-containing protein [uncultured Streptomyces sp.]
MTIPSRARLRSVAALSVAATSCSLLTVATAAPAAAATAACSSPNFTRQFFANTAFSGTSKKTDCDNAISQTWTGAPVSGIPSDNFGVRWSVTRDFGSGGPFALSASAIDGVRVYLDGKRKIDVWKNGSATVSKSVNLTIPSGKHTLRVDYVNWTGTAKVVFGYAPRTSKTVDKVKPLQPTGVKLALDTATAQAKMSWTANREMDLAGYRVYRRLKDTTAYTLVKTTTATSWAGLTPEAGKTYYFEVRAYDKAGNTSTGSVDAPVTAPAMTTPAGFTATGTDTGIKLAWKAVTGATRYRLAGTGPSGATSNRYVTGTGYTDTAVARSADWQYRIAAVDGAGRTSAYTSATDRAALAHRLVAAPHGLTAAPAASAVTLSWYKEAQDGRVAGYRVYRSETLPVNTTTAPAACTPVPAPAADGRTGYTCTDRSIRSGTTYHYVVKAYDGAAKESVATPAVTATTAAEDYTPPAPVTDLTAEATDYGVELRWKNGSEPDIARQRVLIGELVTDEEEGTSVCYAVSSEYVGPAAGSYRDVRLPDGEERCYFVDVQDTSGNNSMRDPEANPVVVVTERDLTPTVGTPEGSPLTVTADRSDGGGAALSWNAAPGATGYLVHRWNPATSAYERIASSDTTSYTDATATAGTTHFYRVTAVYEDGAESVPGTAYAVLPPA